MRTLSTVGILTLQRGNKDFNVFDQKYKKLLSEWILILAQISFFFFNSVCEQKHPLIITECKLVTNF